MVSEVLPYKSCHMLRGKLCHINSYNLSPYAGNNITNGLQKWFHCIQIF